MVKLQRADFDLLNATQRIVEGALGVVSGERLVVVLDSSQREMAGAFEQVARAADADLVVLELETLAPRPHVKLHPQVRSALAGAQASVFMARAQDGEAGMASELLDLVAVKALRHAHMVGVSRDSLLAGFSVDLARVTQVTRGVRAKMRPDSVLRVRSALGTDLTVKLEPKRRWFECGGLVRPGQREPLPPGRLVTAPSEVSGTFVCDGSIGEPGRSPGRLDARAVRFEISAGTVRRVTCLDRAVLTATEAFLKGEALADRVGAVVLGTNVGITRPTGDIACDQNLPGLHLSLGSSLPELTGAHIASARRTLLATIACCDIDLDGAPLMRAGRYLVA